MKESKQKRQKEIRKKNKKRKQIRKRENKQEKKKKKNEKRKETRKNPFANLSYSCSISLLCSFYNEKRVFIKFQTNDEVKRKPPTPIIMYQTLL